MPKSVYALSEDEVDDYDNATDEDEPDEFDTNNELDDSLIDAVHSIKET